MVIGGPHFVIWILLRVNELGTRKVYCTWCGRRYLLSTREKLKETVCPNCGKKGKIYTVVDEST